MDMEINVVYSESKISNQVAGFSPNFEYDSGWNLTDNETDRNLRFTHGLGVAPSLISIFFSPDQERLYPVIWPHYHAASGNPVSIEVTTTAITLGIWRGIPLHGTWDGQTSSWTFWRTGYFRVFASR
ncbi:hypothetical protein [Burkholderia ambifaria]|uniref:Uncharacterized protein n=1 Tax=Burkholderia ambifaria MEX-5 TaxID=396597 RepID=B1TFS1_9BURK|nr:hypothetical protein [Burkholderia ambifaria]EDT37584.1 conserved hypothetical protein [Burkholderia ambifaria MEX-5]